MPANRPAWDLDRTRAAHRQSTIDPTAHTCPTTGLQLIPAAPGHTAWRVVVSSRNPLLPFPQEVTQAGWVQHNTDGSVEVVPWDDDPAWSRWDTVGRTLYAASTRRGAIAEVLQSVRQAPDQEQLARLAAPLGMTAEALLAQVEAEAVAAGMMPRGQVPRSWRVARLVYRLQLPSSGWWVDAEHEDTLAFLSANTEVQDRLRLVGHAGPVDRSHVLGPSRRITATIAQMWRRTVLFDGSYPLGVRWGSKLGLGYGDQWAVWLRHTDDGAEPAVDGVTVLGDGEIIAADDADLVAVSASLNVHVH